MSENMYAGKQPPIDEITAELDGDIMLSLDPYIKIEALAFAQLHSFFGSAKARAKIDMVMPTVEVSIYTPEQAATEIKAWMSLPFNSYLGDHAKQDCTIALEAIQKIREHDSAAVCKMTSEWSRQLGEKMGNWCRVVVAEDKAKKIKAARSVGREAALHFLKVASDASGEGECDAEAINSLAPYQFLLAPEELASYLRLRSKHNEAVGSAPAAPASKKAKTVESSDPHAKTWKLFM